MLDQISESSSNKATQVNENLAAHEAVDTFGYRRSTTTGLTYGMYGGVWAGFTIAASTLVLTASATNYIVVKRSDGVRSASTATTNWNDLANYARIAIVVAGASTLGAPVDHRLNTGGAFYMSSSVGLKNQSIALACSDLVTNLTTGTSKAYFVVPFDFTLTEIQASLFVAQAAGSLLTVDVNENGTSIMTTAKLVFDNGETSTLTAATPPVLTDTALTKGNLVTVDIDQVGTALAKGLIVYLIGYPT